VNLSLEQRLTLRELVTRIEDGTKSVPRVGGAIGRFLAEVGMLQRRVQECAPHDGHFIRGRDIGAIQLAPLAPLRERIDAELLGEHAVTVAVSEELAAPVNVTLWAKYRAANELRNIWLQSDNRIELEGDYRWFAPRRVTPGTAAVHDLREIASVWCARCLKFGADEFRGPPSAASYRWDSFFGPADFRSFRVAPLSRRADGWVLVPSSEQSVTKPVVIRERDGSEKESRGESDLVLALLACDPWGDGWSIVATKSIEPNDVLGHLITWTDHLRELRGVDSPPGPEVSAFQRVLASVGLATDVGGGFASANLRRGISPTARPLAAWVRGLS
jgi:hypothetical protein